MELPVDYACETQWSLGPRAMRVECSAGHGTARTINPDPEPCDHVVADVECGLPVEVIMVGPFQYRRHLRCRDGHEELASWVGASEDELPHCLVKIDGRVCGRARSLV